MREKFKPIVLVEYRFKKNKHPSCTATYTRAGEDSALVSFSNGKRMLFEDNDEAWRDGLRWLEDEGYELVDNEGDSGSDARKLLANAYKDYKSSPHSHGVT